MSTHTPSAPAGWYQKPGASQTTFQWWNGYAWTEQEKTVDPAADRRKANLTGWALGIGVTVVSTVILILSEL